MPCLNLLLDYNNLLLDYNNLLLDYNNLLPDYNNHIIIYYYYNPRININPSCPVPNVKTSPGEHYRWGAGEGLGKSTFSRTRMFVWRVCKSVTSAKFSKKEHSTRLQEVHQPFLSHMQKMWQTRLDFFSLLLKLINNSLRKYKGN